MPYDEEKFRASAAALATRFAIKYFLFDFFGLNCPKQCRKTMRLQLFEVKALGFCPCEWDPTGAPSGSPVHIFNHDRVLSVISILKS